MGLDSRDYFQQPSPEYRFGGSPAYQSGGQGRMIVTRLVIINVVVFLLLFNQVVPAAYEKTNQVSSKFENSSNNSESFARKHLMLHEGIFFTNWEIWQAVTYGFLHGIS